MDHMLTRIGINLIARVTGPMKFRLVFQPAMASFLAIRAGIEDAKTGKPPYFWAVLWDSDERHIMLKEGWKSISKVFIIAIVLDVVYQIIERRFVYPGEAVIVAFVLAIVPYLALRGLTNRFARWLMVRRRHRAQTT